MADDTLKEVDLSLDGFGKQKLLNTGVGYGQKILNLMFLRPGDIPSQPECGLNLPKLIRWKDIDLVTGNNMKETITTQIRRYLPEIPLTEVIIYSTKYRGQPVVIFDFKLVDDITITIGTKQEAGSLITYKIQIEE